MPGWLRLATLLSLAGTAGITAPGSASDAKSADKPAPLAIQVKPAGFGDASAENIQKVLCSAAEQLVVYFPDRKWRPILVERSQGAPIAKFKRGPRGELVVGLNVEGRYWAQFAYQFAHEFTHILSNYQRVDSGTFANQWFLESLCETASMFVITQMAAQWKTNPPYRNWRSFAPHLKDYVADLVNKPERQLPAGTSLAAWFQSNESDFRKNPVDRKKNAIIAVKLLPLFEKKPENWAAIAWLNLGKVDNAESFATFLQRWHDAAPEHLKGFVLEVSDLFGIKLSVETKQPPASL